MKIELILLAISISYVWIYRLGIWPKLKLTFKPFNCEVCLSGWLTIALCIFEGVNVPLSLGNGALAMVLTPIFINFISPRS
jgi:hypothetical protein